MRNEFTAVIERDGDWYIAYCPEIPGANGQGKTIAEVRENLADAIALILEDRREDGLRGVLLTLCGKRSLLNETKGVAPSPSSPRLLFETRRAFALTVAKPVNRRDRNSPST